MSDGAHAEGPSEPAMLHTPDAVWGYGHSLVESVTDAVRVKLQETGWFVSNFQPQNGAKRLFS